MCGAGVTVTRNLDKVYMCEMQEQEENYSVTCMILNKETRDWEKLFTTDLNLDKILMLSLSQDERWCIGTLHSGFKLWHQNGRRIKKLVLPHNVRLLIFIIFSSIFKHHVSGM